MTRRYNDKSRSYNEAPSPVLLVDALERDDWAEVDRLRGELVHQEEGSLLRLEHEAEDVARRRRAVDSLLDRIRNVFQAILLRRRLGA